MVNSKLRRHKVMERAIKAVMSGNLPPKFKYKDTYESIELPTGYTLPSQQDIEVKFEELLAEEEAEPKTSILGDLEVGTANLFVDTMTSNVGVGTSTPGYALDVVGDINLSGDFYQGGEPFVSSEWTSGADSLYYRSNLEVGTANLFVDTTTSNVGIGTDTPGYKLDVVGNVHADYFIGDGTLLSNVVNDTDLQSNVTILREEIDSNLATARTDLQSNVTILRTDLQSNVTILREEIDSNLETARTDLQSNVTRFENGPPIQCHYFEGGDRFEPRDGEDGPPI
jgi:hypothetical protein